MVVSGAAVEEDRVSRIVVFESVTLDGVMQAPGRPDEDTRGGFEHGGWAAPYADPVMGEEAAKGMAQTGGILLGRRTYEDFHSFWPKQAENPFTDALNNTQKYVASTTLAEPLPWINSTLLRGDVAEEVGRLKAEREGDIVVLGSGRLVASLIEHDLVDEFVLLIHPLVLGSGHRLFAEGSTTTRLRLVESKPTTTGVVIATYRPAESG
jgi:dihydrofolate reductase